MAKTQRTKIVEMPATKTVDGRWMPESLYQLLRKYLGSLPYQQVSPLMRSLEQLPAHEMEQKGGG